MGDEEGNFFVREGCSIVVAKFSVYPITSENLDDKSFFCVRKLENYVLEEAIIYVSFRFVSCPSQTSCGSVSGENLCFCSVVI